MIIIETDMKYDTNQRVSFEKVFRSLLVTNGLTKLELNYILLSNTKVGNDRFYYQREPKGYKDKKPRVWYGIRKQRGI